LVHPEPSKALRERQGTGSHVTSERAEARRVA
jgi:hypothetical protein